MTVEIKQCDRELAIAICRLTGWRGVADRLEQGWQPMPDTSESEILALIAAFRIQSEHVAKMKEVLEWVRKEIVGLCEATEDDPALIKISVEDIEGKQGAYARGRIREAKDIRRTMAEVIRNKLSTLPQEQRQEAATEGEAWRDMFESGYLACYAEQVAHSMKGQTFTLDDAILDRAWDIYLATREFSTAAGEAE